MPTSPTPNRGYFRFTKGETPEESNVNEGLVDKIDADVHSALNNEAQLQIDLAALKDRVDAHSDGAGNLTGVPPEFNAFVGTIAYMNPTQFSVTGNFTNDFSINRALRATLGASTPVSDIKTAAYSSGTNLTTITLFDAILDNTLSGVALGFIKTSMPKVSASDLDFDPATQAELDAHKAAGEHDNFYIKKAANTPVAPEVTLNDIRVQKNSAINSPKVQMEDTNSIVSHYRIGTFAQINQVLRLFLVRASDLAIKLFLDLDAANDKLVLQQKLDANGKAVINLPAPGGASDAARLVDVPVAGTTPSTQAIGDSAAGGSAATFSKNDHKHAMPGFGAPVTQAFNDTPQTGSAATVARSDHRHGMPALTLLEATFAVSIATGETQSSLTRLYVTTNTVNQIIVRITVTGFTGGSGGKGGSPSSTTTVNADFTINHNLGKKHSVTPSLVISSTGGTFTGTLTVNYL